MKFIVNSTLLLKEIQKLSSLVSSTNTLPILDNFLFDITSNKLSIIASDLETTMISSIQIESQDDGKIAIPSRMLLDTLKSFSNNLLTFIVDMEKFTVEMSSETGNYKLAGQNGDDFPKTPSLSTSNKININSSVLLNAINKTLFASGNDELRPVMLIVYLII